MKNMYLNRSIILDENNNTSGTIKYKNDNFNTER